MLIWEFFKKYSIYWDMIFFYLSLRSILHNFASDNNNEYTPERNKCA